MAEASYAYRRSKPRGTTPHRQTSNLAAALGRFQGNLSIGADGIGFCIVAAARPSRTLRVSGACITKTVLRRDSSMGEVVNSFVNRTQATCWISSEWAVWIPVSSEIPL